MVRNQDLINIYKKLANKDSKGFIEISLDIIKNEESLNHFKVSSTLTKLIEQIQDKNAVEEQWKEEFSEIPMDRDRTLNLIEVSLPNLHLNNIILESEKFEKIQRILTEWKERCLLAQYGLKPIRKVLFFGPSGCGKTLCASIFASEMQVPMLTVKTDILVSSLLGETSINIRKIFENINKDKLAVLFFDEFDSIAKNRNDLQEHGELRRAVSNLLQFIDNSPNNILVIAATNNPDLLDHAIWRRFDEVFEFSYPNENEIAQLIELKLQNFDHNINVSEIIPILKGFSHAEIERICLMSMKTAILTKKNFVDQEIFLNHISDFKMRKGKIKSNISQ